MDSLKINYYNCPEPVEFDLDLLPKEEPAFLSYTPNFNLIGHAMEECGRYRNIIIVGHGGSISTFYGFYNLWELTSGKRVYFLNTVDPQYIEDLKRTVTPKDTVVIAISKSGETVTQVEALLSFSEYKLVVIAGKGTALWQVGEKESALLVEHPVIGGRYTGLTEVVLLPAALCGFDVRGLYEGAQRLWKKYGEKNSAFAAASILHQLEERGIVDVFMPIYGKYLFGMSFSIIQLCHESFGKSGKGQTYFAHEAPESQHHTNQRFFGGRKNIAGWFLHGNQNNPLTVKVPENIRDIPFKDKTIGVLDGLSLADCLNFEREGTLEHAIEAGIPAIDTNILDTTPETIGEFLAFWQLYAVYSSALRGVNPFDQPEVEASKIISWKKRLGVQ